RPSLHGALFGGWTQAPPPSQRSSVQPLPSSPQAVPDGVAQASVDSLQVRLHSTPALQGAPACSTQLPPLQVSAPLQNRPSEQGALFAGWTQAPLPLQRSSVQPLPSSG